MKIIMGIDPGTHITGYCLLCIEDDGTQKLLLKGCTVSDDELLANRLEDMYVALYDIAQSHNITEIAVETQYYGVNPNATAKVIMVTGLAYLISAQIRRPCFGYAPTAVKKSVTGNGAADKQMVAKRVRKIFKLKKNKREPLDVTDAIAVALCHVNHTNERIDTHGKKQRTAKLK